MNRSLISKDLHHGEMAVVVAPHTRCGPQHTSHANWKEPLCRFLRALRGLSLRPLRLKALLFPTLTPPPLSVSSLPAHFYSRRQS